MDTQKTPMTAMDERELLDRAGGMSQEERMTFLQSMETIELYSELGRRLKEVESFVAEMDSVITDFNKKIKRR